MPEAAWPGDDSPVLMVNPAEVDLPEIKARAADLGVNVKGSSLVPSGQAFIYDPNGGLGHA